MSIIYRVGYYRVIIHPSNIKNIQSHEVEAAQVLAAYFRSNVEFISPSKGYRMRSPDVIVAGVDWEIKSPTGNSKSTTIQKQFKGLRQSRNLIIDGRRMGLADSYALSKIRQELRLRKNVQRVLYIQKSGMVIDCRQKPGYNKK